MVPASGQHPWAAQAIQIYFAPRLACRSRVVNAPREGSGRGTGWRTNAMIPIPSRMRGWIATGNRQAPRMNSPLLMQQEIGALFDMQADAYAKSHHTRACRKACGVDRLAIILRGNSMQYTKHVPGPAPRQSAYFCGVNFTKPSPDRSSMTIARDWAPEGLYSKIIFY